MFDDLKEEAIVNKVGGRFKLSTLIQKRLVALNTGAAPLVAIASSDRLAIVLAEIQQGKIYLDVSGEVQTHNATTSETIRTILDHQMRGGGGAGSAAAPAGAAGIPNPEADPAGDED